MKLFKPVKKTDIIEIGNKKPVVTSRVTFKDKNGQPINKFISTEIPEDNSFDLADAPNNKLRVGFFSTWKIQCGIAVYAEHLYNAAKHNGCTVFAYPHTINIKALLKQIDIDHIHILSIQYEPAIMPQNTEFKQFLLELRKRRIKVVLTLHSEPTNVKALYDLSNLFLYHKTPILFDKHDPKIKIVPMGVPVFNPNLNLADARKKYGFNSSDKIITTTGFMFTWKQHANILEMMVPYLNENKDVKVQLLTSYNSVNPSECNLENQNIKTVIDKYNLKDRVIHITNFLSQEELSERLWLSVLGYLWSDITTSSSSAAGKEFITARLPLVVTNSSHYHDLKEGVIRTEMNKEQFINTIFSNLNNLSLSSLRQELQNKYMQLNYNSLILSYLEEMKRC